MLRIRYNFCCPMKNFLTMSSCSCEEDLGDTIFRNLIELDDGKILTKKKLYLMGIKPMDFRLRFSQQNQSSENLHVPIFFLDQKLLLLGTLEVP